MAQSPYARFHSSFFRRGRGLCGIACLIVWHWQILALFLRAKQASFPGQLGDSIHLFLFAGIMLTALAAPRLRNFFGEQGGRGWVVSAATLCMLSLLFSLLPSEEEGRRTLAALAVSGAGSAVLFWAWLDAASALPYRAMIDVLGGGFVLATGVNGALSLCPQPTVVVLCVFSLLLSRFLLPPRVAPEPQPDGEEYRRKLPSFLPYHELPDSKCFVAMVFCICLSAGMFYSMVVFLRPMGGPSPLTLTALFGVGALLGILFLNLPLEKDIYQAFLLVVPFLLCGYASWPIVHGESPGLSLVGMRLGYGLLAVYLFAAVGSFAARLTGKDGIRCACLATMSFAFWLGAQVCSLDIFDAYDVRRLDMLLAALLILLLSSCGACVFWLYQTRHSILNWEKRSQEDGFWLDVLMERGLTQQQAIIALLLSQKIPDAKICRLLSISPLTLETHIRNIHKRMGINSRHELMWMTQYRRQDASGTGRERRGGNG